MAKSALDRKLGKLREIIFREGSAVVAFSGGVDSTFLLRVASEILGRGLLAVTATSPTYTESELNGARKLAKSFGVRHMIVDSNELKIPNFAGNPVNRCYYCKSELFSILRKIADSKGMKAVFDGSNADDESDYRPGRKAAKEIGVLSPLSEAGLSKDEIRTLSRRLGLKTWDKPSMACLASRFPYGTKITSKRLKMVEAAEAALKLMGFRTVRVRYEGDTARIELGQEEIRKAARKPTREKIAREFRKIGFVYSALDIEGYRTGSMNLALKRG